ncbi:Tubulin-specific chaperone D [Trichinella pseudospiralis]|uniref:Tubulin-specific chaperone D n=3 Tax=Trichinella pseudospiralis TaxID=6337 RepID=A0A0V1I9N4_TRIPS|nr:Tubulin-specific chaperone D [Trichinella pseudospiralis]
MDDDEIDTDVVNSVVVKDNFTEWLVHVRSMVIALPNETEREDVSHLEACFERFCHLLDEFQVKPSLLDPVMVSVLPILIGYILDCCTSCTLRDESFKYANQLVKVRGAKASLRHFPCQVSLLKNVLLMLEEESLDSRGRCTHEKVSVLLLWLIVLSKVPFNLDNAQEMVNDEQFVGSYAQKIFDLALLWFHGRGREQLLAARLLAELVTRPDAIHRLPEVLKMAVEWLSTMKSNESSEKLSVAICWAQCLAACLKKASRSVMKKHAKWLHDQLNALPDFQWKAQDVCMRKMWSKLSQRIALVILKPRLNDEQLYRRGMLDKLTKEDEELSEEKCQKVPKLVKEIAIRLVDMLHDTSCLVRWSAAKGVGRLAARLPSKQVSRLVDWILDLISNIAASADDIQGVCLALAELCRHGLIPSDKLEQVVSSAKQALKFDQIGCALSSSVRDSACYLCWTFGRSLTKKAMLPHAYHLAPHLLVVALFDREVTCRRAASAAFQENVGRHQLFPYGIEVLTAADYYAVSNLRKCYGEIALQVAQYGEYLRPIMECLVEKISHWDEQIRVLAAGTLAALTPSDPCYIAVQVFPQLWCLYRKAQFFSKHGAMVALAKLGVALYKERNSFAYLLAGEQGFNNFQQRWKDEIMEIPKEISEAGLLLKTYGFSYMSAICDLIVEASESGMPVKRETLQFWFAFLKSNLTNADETTRQVSVKALRAAYHAHAENYFAADAKQQLIEYLELLIGRLEKPNSEMDCVGAALELSCFCNLMFNLQQGRVVQALSDCFGDSRGPRRAWVKARQACLKAMFHVAVSFKLVGWKADITETTLFACDYLEVLRCHTLAMEDLTRTVVGDVGMLVRRQALQNLCELVRYGAKAEGMLLVRSDLMVLLTQNLLQQCLDVNHLQRKLACSVMVDILSIEPPRPFLVNRDDLERAFLKETVEWISPTQAYGRLISFLAMPAFQKHLLFAYVLAIGSESQSVAESALVSLIDYASSLPTVSFYMSQLMENFLSLFHNYSNVGWLSLLLMKALQKILSMGIFPKHCEEVEDWQLSRLYVAVSKSWNVEKGSGGVHHSSNITKSKLLKLRAVVDLCCEFMQYSKLQAATEARRTVVALLTHPCLNIRRYAASRFYETLLCSDPDSSDVKICQTMQLLEQTDWCAPVEDLEPLCQQLSTLIEID